MRGSKLRYCRAATPPRASIRAVHREGGVTRSRYWVAPFLLLLAVASAFAESRPLKPEASSAPAGSGFYANSWALVIGINRYQRIPGLTYAVADANAVAEALPP